MPVKTLFPQTILHYQNLIEASIRKLRTGKAPVSLYEPIHYMMQLGGKRLRPLLVLLAYSLYRTDVRKAVPYAVAVELFHNFTLVHDDIMDNAPLRRGKPTVHEKWSVSTAILSGDVMLVKVYNLFLSLPPEKAVQVLKQFNTCATQVCEGQQLDMEFEKQTTVTEKEYIGMIAQKTAALLGFSLELGARLAGAPEADCRALNKLGLDMGIGFQLMDDLLDAYGDPEKFGKQTGGDIMANKKTYLLITSLQKASAAQRKKLNYWLNATHFNREEKINAVKRIWDDLNVRQDTELKIQQYFKRAFRQLGRVKGRKAGMDLLKQFTHQLMSRQV
ncbi:MAG: isoprenyl synthetase [Cyclobacteriaceae bacterium]|nr:MAG: isoprenyl synthetase [Cyclobacteriaceae bacterium]